jgi:hypothetical protein
MIPRDHRGHATIEFLRKGSAQVAAAQSCFHVPDGYAGIKSRRRTGHARGGIAMNEKEIRPLIVKHPGHGQDHRSLYVS